MNEIDLRRFDLNLLVVFEVLMAECSVTRAAERLGRTQSAVSHSLSRLRAQLGDPLLIKGARGMQPTDFALEFMAQVRPTLRSIQRALSARQAFDPTTSRRLFRFAAPDFARTLFTSLLARVRTEAPGVSIEWTGTRDPMLLQIADGQIDVAVVPADLRLPDGVTGESVGALKWECFARRGQSGLRQWGTVRMVALAPCGGPGGRRPDKPGKRRCGRCRPPTDDCRLGAAFLGDRTCSRRLRSVGHTAIARHARHVPAIRSRIQTRAVFHRSSAACHAVERWSQQ